MATYRYNRAVNAQNKGDTFEAEPNDPEVKALLGAGYADPVFEDEPEVWTDTPDYEPAFIWDKEE